MTRSVDPEQDLLAGIRRVLGPTPLDQERVRAKLATAIAAGAISELGPGDLAPPPGARGGAVSLGIQGVGKQLAVATLIGVAGFGTGYLSGRSGSDVHPPAPAPAAARSAPEASPPAVVAAPAAEAPPTTDGEHRPLQRRALPSAPTTIPRDPALLSQEAEMLNRVGAALRSGYPLRAEQLLDELDAQIPHGALGEERTAARLMVGCRLQHPRARDRAARWLERHPQSVYAPRLRASCSTGDDAVDPTDRPGPGN